MNTADVIHHCHMSKNDGVGRPLLVDVPHAGHPDAQKGWLISFHTDHVLRHAGTRYGFGYTPTGAWKNNGPGMPRTLCEQPTPYVFAMAVCIDNNGGTARESAEMTAAGKEHEVAIGDVVLLDGIRFRVVEHRGWGDEKIRLQYEEVDSARL